MKDRMTSPAPVEGTPAKPKQRRKSHFQITLPVADIDNYMKTPAGLRLKRSAVVADIERKMQGAADEALAQAGGVEGVMKAILG